MFDDAPPSAGEVRAMAHQLMAWADYLLTRPAPGRELSAEEKHELVLAAAHAMRDTGALRARLFDMPFGNPNWDVMLDLFIRDANGYRVTADQLALGGEVAAATVHCCLDVLAARGLIERTPDRFDSNVKWLSLSPVGKQAMVEFMLQTARFFSPCADKTAPPIPSAEQEKHRSAG
jgi:hypothetical protein